MREMLRADRRSRISSATMIRAAATAAQTLVAGGRGRRARWARRPGSRRSSPEVDGFEAEIAALGEIVRELGSPFPVVLVSPASDLKCTLPGSPWPPCPPAVELYRAARRAFPDARVGGGMFSYFTELNRKRPPLESLTS